MKKILYIVGAGRSGSTLLDICIGNNTSHFGCGELVNAVGAYLNGEYCSCGLPVNTCPFWSNIIDKWAKGADLSTEDMRNFAKLDNHYCHPRRLRAWIAGFIPGMTHSHRWYLKLLRHLLDIISKEVSGNVICDSSKHPVRLLHLQQAWQGSIQAIHLIRDPYAVIESLNKNFQKDKKAGIQKNIPKRHPARTALWWITINWMSELVCAIRKVTYIRIQYEKFIHSPVDECKRIDPSMGYHPPLYSKHTVAGNRLRMQREILVNPASATHKNKVTADPGERLARILCKPLRNRYGY